MNLEHLKYFNVLAKEEHFGRAARVLNISQPGLSHAIDALERELGVELFTRKGRNLVLNEYGRNLMEYSEKIASLNDACVDNFKWISQCGGSLHIACVMPLAVSLLPSLIDSFGTKKAKFNVSTGVSEDILDGILNYKYDIGFCSKVMDNELLEFRESCKCRLAFLVPKIHRLAFYSSCPIKEISDEPLILFSKTSGLRPLVDRLFDLGQVAPKVRFEVDDGGVMARFVDQGLGIAVLPRFYATGMDHSVLVDIDGYNTAAAFYMVRRKEKRYLSLEKEFWEFSGQYTGWDMS